MILIPAVDIRGGNCVRLLQGRAEDETVYSPDPLKMAKKWQDMGAKRLHVVDLDGAFSGKTKNAGVILRIAKELDIPVQTGGGIRDYETVRRLLAGGISRVILGTSALYDRGFLKKAVSEWPEKIIVGIDSRSGKVATAGWKEVSIKDACDFAQEVQKMGVREIIVTDIKKDGTMKGPNVRWIEKVARKVDISVIASGGVSGVEDLKSLKELKLSNLTGVIVGKALYADEGFMPKALRTLKEEN